MHVFTPERVANKITLLEALHWITFRTFPVLSLQHSDLQEEIFYICTETMIRNFIPKESYPFQVAEKKPYYPSYPYEEENN